MASVRKSQRSRSAGGDQQTPTQSPNTKRKRGSSPISSTVVSTSLVADTECIQDATEIDDIDIEEEVVTVDITEGDQSFIVDDFDTEITETIVETEVETTNSSSQPETGGVSENVDPSLGESTSEQEKPSAVFVFKDPNFVHSSKGAGGNKRTRVWKNLKQIVAAERLLPWGPDDVTYGSIDAPPSFKPAKKYSDISGLESKYTDPQTKMRYANADEYRRIRMLPGDIITGCLALRKANNLVP